jgi:hypothetical protein
VLGLVALGNTEGENLCVSTTGIQPGDVPPGGAYFGNWKDFPAWGAILHYMHLGKLYQIPINTSFPWIASTVF